MPDNRIVEIDAFMKLAKQYPVFDVRTPDEFASGHIPAAINLPLFSNEERAEVGKIYTSNGRNAAVLKGLDSVGPKMRKLVEAVRAATDEKTLLLHCWRGGMRSSSLSWLLNLVGYNVYLLKDGYKAFRRFVLEAFGIPRNIIILSGATGSGKTEILNHLRKKDEQVIDLERNAQHKGSAFGGLGEHPQPTQQNFENLTALQWDGLDSKLPVWLEDESQKIGSRMIPQNLWAQMRNSIVIYLKMPIELRVERLCNDYGCFETTELQAATERLRKRIGGLHAKTILESIEKGDLKKSSEFLLRHYYDKTYLHGLSRRNSNLIYSLETTTLDAKENAEKILQFSQKILERV